MSCEECNDALDRWINEWMNKRAEIYFSGKVVIMEQQIEGRIERQADTLYFGWVDIQMDR